MLHVQAVSHHHTGTTVTAHQPTVMTWRLAVRPRHMDWAPHQVRQPMDPPLTLRHWLVERLLALAPTWLLAGTPWLAAYYRLLGARIGRHVLSLNAPGISKRSHLHGPQVPHLTPAHQRQAPLLRLPCRLTPLAHLNPQPTMLHHQVTRIQCCACGTSAESGRSQT